MNVPQRPSGFISDLCVALAHRWDPERIFVILTAYLDESGTHGDSPITVMAGVMSNASEWARFEAAFEGLKAKYGFRVLHTKKFKRRGGDFKGWDLQKQIALMGELAALLDSAFGEGVTFTLDNAEYEATYRGGDKPRRLRIESKYGLCFRNCLMFLTLQAAERARTATSPPKLHLVIESGHPNWSEVRDIFRETRQEVKAVSGYDLLGDITFADKDKCDPLMMADFFAHAAYLTALGQMPRPPNEQPFLEGADAQLQSSAVKQSGVTHLRHAPGGLADLKNVMIEKLKAKRASPVSSGGQSS